LSLPRYQRRRYRYAADRTLLVAEIDDGEGVATGETVLRLAEVPLDDPGAVLGFVNAVGTIGMSEDAESQTVAEFTLVVEAVRDAVTAWRVLQDDDGLEEIVWHLPRLRDVPATELPEAAAEFLTVVLDTGLAPVRPRVTLAVNGGDAAEPPLLDLTLYALSCCELFNHVVSGNDFRVCANESCERLFVRDETARRRGVLYCSRTCARAQAQREFRRRRAEQKT
jgi:predicted RNA-binding Zn ribbon-like protein